MSSGEGLIRNAARALERVNEEGVAGSGSVTPEEGRGERIRPLEDPYVPPGRTSGFFGQPLAVLGQSPHRQSRPRK